MGRMGSDEGVKALTKLLLIGDGKSGKSYYAALAAKAGFNVLYLDGDVAAPTIGAMVSDGTLTKEEANRIYLLDIRDTIMGGVRDTRFVEFMNELSSSVVLKWNETENRVAKRNDTGEIWELKPSKMGMNDVLIIDSWTGYTESVMLWAGRANGVDIANASTHEMRPVYQGGALKATEMLQVIRSMPCHVIVIAHPDEFSHMSKPDGKRVKDIKEPDLIVDWTKMIPKTTSKPQGLQMAKYFSDVAWMEMSPDGKERRLNFKPKNDRVSGGHFDDTKGIMEYSFANLVKKVSGYEPDKNQGTDNWLTISQVDEVVPVESKVLDGTTAAPLKAAGVSGLFGQKK